MLEAEKILSCLRKVVGQLSGDTMRTNQLADLLIGAGFSSNHLAPRLASKLCMNFLHGAEPETSGGKRFKFPARVMQVEAGFPRMALCIAYYLHNACGYRETVSKSLAKSMVEVWIKYDISYKSLRRICSEIDKTSVKKYLKNLLEVKGKKNPKGLDFSSLVNMTVQFFDNLNN